MAEAVVGLLHEPTRPADELALKPETIERVHKMTLGEPPGEATR